MRISRAFVLDALAVVVAGCAVYLTILTVSERRTGAPPATVEVVEDWKRYSERGSIYNDPPEPTVTLVQFSDYLCPACRRLHLAIDSLLAEDETAMRVVYRHFPLESLHPLAEQAAIASECAALQGGFREYHSLLFHRQAEIMASSFVAFAGELGLPDIPAFAACLDSSERVRSLLSADSVAAIELGIRGTPLLLLNDRVFRGAPDRTRLRTLVDSAVRGW